MMFMNGFEIEDAAQRYASHPVLGPATATLHTLMRWTDRNSDGWAYWPKPCRAAEKLMRLIDGSHADIDPREIYRDDDRVDATPARLKVALSPVKAFRTRQGADFTIFETAADIEAARQRAAEAAEAAERAELARLQVKYPAERS